MKETVYIETSILGYLTARPGNNLILMANLEMTQRWWHLYRSQFDTYISQIVLDEAASGDPDIALKRVQAVQGFPLLAVNDPVEALAAQFLRLSNLPDKASNDALHIALATFYGLDYLLTWNCKHIANAKIQRKLSEISRRSGYTLPTICTPFEFLGE